MQYCSLRCRTIPVGVNANHGLSLPLLNLRHLALKGKHRGTIPCGPGKTSTVTVLNLCPEVQGVGESMTPLPALHTHCTRAVWPGGGQ